MSIEQFVAAAGILAVLSIPAHAQQAETRHALAYDGYTRGPVPIRPAERSRQTVTAEPWFTVSNDGLPLEGPSFDRAGDLLVVTNDGEGGQESTIFHAQAFATALPLYSHR